MSHYTTRYKRKTAVDYHELAKRRGYVWLGTDTPRLVTIKTQWMCSNGHIWNSRFSDIQTGYGCKICGREKAAAQCRVKITAGDCRSLAQSKGITWIGETPPAGMSKKTTWQCQQGHVWSVIYSEMLNSKFSGCKVCANQLKAKNRRLTINDYHEMGAKNNLMWKESLSPGAMEKTLWQCPNHHTFWMTYADVSQGHNCPYCDHRVNGHRTSSEQREIAQLVNGTLNYRIGRLGIDVALVDEKIAIEYDCWYWHKNNVERDERKTQTLISKGWRLLRIKTNRIAIDPPDIINAVSLLRNGAVYIEIVTADWGN